MLDSRSHKSEASDGSASKDHLDPAQQAAIQELLLGKSVAEAAKATGVSRATVYRWLKHDANFQAVHNQWHEELKESSRSRLLMLTDKATTALEKALEAGDAKAALVLLTALGMLRPDRSNLIEPEEIQKQNEINRKRRKLALERADRKLDVEDQMSRLADRELMGLAEEERRRKNGE